MHSLGLLIQIVNGCLLKILRTSLLARRMFTKESKETKVVTLKYYKHSFTYPWQRMKK